MIMAVVVIQLVISRSDDCLVKTRPNFLTNLVGHGEQYQIDKTRIAKRCLNGVSNGLQSGGNPCRYLGYQDSGGNTIDIETDMVSPRRQLQKRH